MVSAFRITDYILPQFFFAALFVGLLYSMLVKPDTVVIIKHPTPYNADSVTYKDGQKSCYKYAVEETTCPSDPAEIEQYSFAD